MANIHNVQSATTAARIDAVTSSAARRNDHAFPGDDATVRSSDSVEFSAHARELSAAARTEAGTESGPVRAHLVARIRAEIEAGTYESDLKAHLAADALARDLNG